MRSLHGRGSVSIFEGLSMVRAWHAGISCFCWCIPAPLRDQASKNNLSPPFTEVLVCAHGWPSLDLPFAGDAAEKRFTKAPGTDLWQVIEMVNLESDTPPYASLPVSVCRAPANHERNAIDAAVAQIFGLTAQQMQGPTRGRAPAARARQVAMYVTHISCGMSLTDVGTMFARDRTTVSHACIVIEDRRDDPNFDRILDLLEWIVRELLLRTGRGQLLSN